MRKGCYALVSLGFLTLSAPSAFATCSGQLEGVLRATGQEYDPFHPADLYTRHAVSVRNIGSAKCEFIVVFHREPAEGRLGQLLSYRIEELSGEALLTASFPPIASRYLATGEVEQGRTATITYQIVVPRGQFAPPNLYADVIRLSLHTRDKVGHVNPVAVDTQSLQIERTVLASVRLNVAGGGLTTTVNFGELAQGKERSVLLNARANHSYKLALRSKNENSLKLDPTIPGQDWSVPYTLRVNGEAVALRPAAPIVRSRPLSSGEETHSLAFKIDDAMNKRAGLYRDTITIEVSVNP